MRFGVGLFTAQRPPGYSRPYTEIYKDLLSHAELIEEVGLDSFWTTEHHFTHDGYLPATIPLCAAVAARTSRILIGPGALAPLYHPLRLAEDIIAVDLISRGRVVAEVGTGYRPEEFKGFGVDQSTAAERLDETLEILRLAFTGKPFAFAGRHFQISELEVTPHPYRQGGPPLLIPGNSDFAAQLAGRKNLSYKVDPSVSWEEALRVVGVYDAARDRAAPPTDLAIQCYGFISEGDAWEEVRDGFLYTRDTYDRWAGLPGQASRLAADYRLVLGDPETVAAELDRYRRQFGDRVHIIYRLSYPGMDPEAVSRAIRQYGLVADELRRLHKDKSHEALGANSSAPDTAPRPNKMDG